MKLPPRFEFFLPGLIVVSLGLNLYNLFHNDTEILYQISYLSFLLHKHFQFQQLLYLVLFYLAQQHQVPQKASHKLFELFFLI